MMVPVDMLPLQGKRFAWRSQSPISCQGDDQSWLYFLNTRTGELLRKEEIHIGANPLYARDCHIYLVTSLDGGGEVDAAGKVLRRFGPPIWIEGGVEAAR